VLLRILWVRIIIMLIEQTVLEEACHANTHMH
jgi:hypothetical protein